MKPLRQCAFGEAMQGGFYKLPRKLEELHPGFLVTRRMKLKLEPMFEAKCL